MPGRHVNAKVELTFGFEMPVAGTDDRNPTADDSPAIRLAFRDTGSESADSAAMFLDVETAGKLAKAILRRVRAIEKDDTADLRERVAFPIVARLIRKSGV